MEESPEPAAPDSSFPERVICPRCRRPWRVASLRVKTDVLLTKVKLSCPECRKPIQEMRLKDWYDHYVQSGKVNAAP